MKSFYYLVAFYFVLFSFCTKVFSQVNVPHYIPLEIKQNLVKVKVKYLDFDNQVRKGCLIVHKDVAEEVEAIFDSLLVYNFPIYKISALENYGWDDNNSMNDNNTTAFNYRYNLNNKNKLSKHAYGLAIDINPLNNPVIYNGRTIPKDATYNLSKKGTIGNNSIVVKIFKKYGWRWGGNFKKVKDYQHFEK
jgi:hypothetical protein